MNFDKYNEFLVNLAKRLMENLDENSRLLRFATDKEEDNFNTLQIITILYLLRSGEHEAVTTKNIEALYGGCRGQMDFDLWMMLTEGYVFDHKESYQTWQDLKTKFVKT